MRLLTLILALALVGCKDSGSVDDMTGGFTPPPDPSISWQQIVDRWGKEKVADLMELGLQKYHFVGTFMMERAFFEWLRGGTT